MDSRILTSELDFNNIRNSIADYLRNRGEFTDYNFEGAGLSAILDVLALNTHFQTLAANFSLNESFLDSAQLRSSVVSRAKPLNYFPRTRVSARAEIDVSITGATATGDVVLPKYTRFTSSIDNQTYTFYTLDDYITNSENSYIFRNVSIFEGRLLTKRFVVDSPSDTYPIYVVPDSNLFSDSMSVIVREGLGSNNSAAYRLPVSVNDFRSNQAIYILSESSTGYYEITFGDGIIGLPPSEGSIIEIKYLSSAGAEVNGAMAFSTVDTVNGRELSASTNVAAQGGSEKESIESIRFNAPRNYSAQNRAVTVSDYKTLIENFASYTEAVNVWGGQENVPPVYGKVFISIKPVGRDAITDTERIQLEENVLNNRSIVSITPEFVDPIFQHIEIRANVDYDSTKTPLTQQQLENKIKGAILQFGSDQLINFDSTFRRSALLTFIDNSDSSVISSDADVFIQRRLIPEIGVAARYDLSFTLPLASVNSVDRVVTSDIFQYTIDGESFDCALRNKIRSTTLEIVRLSSSGEVIVVDDAGFIDTVTNTITLIPFVPSGIQDTVNGIRFSAVPANPNTISPLRNSLIRFDDDNTTVVAIDNA